MAAVSLQNDSLIISLKLPLPTLEFIMTIEQTATETVEKAKQAATETAAKAKKVVATEVAKAEKLAEEVKTTATEAVQKVSDLVQAESNSAVEKVKSLIAQLKTLQSEKSFADISSEAAALLKEVQTNGLQALKHDYTLLRTAVVGNYETLQANSSLKTFVNDLLEKLTPSK
ncbi:MAG TPA: hypothetical protein VIH30_01145 [Aquirhabdus sp.]